MLRPSQGSFPTKVTHETCWIAFTEWNSRQRQNVVIAVHGLARQARDFDELGHALAPDFRTIAVDMVGRGRSGWLSDKEGYTYDSYIRHCHALLKYRGLEQVDWVGTSMGGLIGMMIAAQEETPIKHLVLNDVGPFIPKAALEFIGTYVGTDPRFDNLNAVGDYMRETYASWGPLPDIAWSEMVQHSVIREADGSYRLHYDPAIGDIFQEEQKDVDLWALWDMIEIPVLVLRGADSTLLTRETAEEMTRRGPKATLVEIPECGHAPSLMVDSQTHIIRNWLLEQMRKDEMRADGIDPDLAEHDDPLGRHLNDK
ncbi:MAG: alpha/beta hydrolase [Alphaproteobacteria bacterium]|nr:alpha/beta hydrolase [Alphaproteobacteria bacterium]